MQCGAKTRNGTPCKSRAMANGRCRMHGGTQPVGAASPNFKTGRYSKYLKDSLKNKLDDAQTGDPLDLLPELEVQRALFSEYIGRFQEGMALSAYDIDYLFGWSAEIGKSVERIVKMKNDSALTQVEIKFLAARIVEVVGDYIADPDRRAAFIHDLFTGLPALDAGTVSAVSTERTG